FSKGAIMRLQISDPVTSRRRTIRRVLVTSLSLMILLSALVIQTVSQKPSLKDQAGSSNPANTLTPAEKAAGWKLLFDGKTTNGWRGFRREKFPEEGWVIEGGAIRHVPGNGEQSQNGGDIITVEQYDNFELQLEWRISPGGNSGIKYLVA